MPCQSCGKKHPLSRANRAARHFTNMPRRKFGVTPPSAPVTPPLEVSAPEVQNKEGGEPGSVK